MESKELNEILNKTRRTPDISLTPKQVKELIKDLEQKELLEIELELEKEKVKYLMKQLKVLDAIKKEFYNTFSNWYSLDKMESLKLDNEPKNYEIIRQWLKQWLEDKN